MTKLKRLLLSAAQYAVDHTKDSPGMYETMFLHRYAELILEECCDIIDTGSVDEVQSEALQEKVRSLMVSLGENE